MNIFITSDANQETKLGEIIVKLSQKGYKDFFKTKHYGFNLDLSIVLMCRNPEHNFKQRIRFDKIDNKLRFDLMFDYEIFTKINDEEKYIIIANKLINEVPSIINKYKLKDFYLELFTEDLRNFFKQISWL